MRQRIEDYIIFDAALKLFAKYGYKKTTLEDIAQELNMTNSNLYSYSRSKKDLYKSSLDYAINRWQSKVFKKVEVCNTNTEKLEALFIYGNKYFTAEKDLCEIASVDESILPTAKEIEYNGTRTIDFIESIIDEGVKSEEFNTFKDNALVAGILYNMFSKFIEMDYINKPKISAAAVEEQLVELMFNGLLKK